MKSTTVYCGHDPKINYEEVLNIPCYGGGECAPANPIVSIFTKLGNEYVFRVRGNIRIVESSNHIKIKTAAVSSFNREVKL